MTQRCSVATASNSSAPLHFSINVTVPCSLHPDRTITNLSVPVEGCERLPGLPGVRKVGPDSLTRRCSDQGCNFGTRAGLNSAAIPALRALATADTGSPSQRSPDFATSVARYVRTSQPSPGHDSIGEHQVGVDPDGAEVQSRWDVVAASGVLGPHRRGQAVGNGVGACDGVGFVG